MTRKTITEKKEVTWEVQGRLHGVIDFLKAQQRAGWERIELDYDRGYYDSVSIQATLSKYRPETDEEMNLRELEEAALKEQQLKRERTQYEKLRKQFENQ
jgi:hypothetical protein